MPCRLKYCAYSCRFCQGQGSFYARKRGGDGAAAKMGSLAGGLVLGRRGLFLRAVGLVKTTRRIGRPAAILAANHSIKGLAAQCMGQGFFCIHSFSPFLITGFGYYKAIVHHSLAMKFQATARLQKRRTPCRPPNRGGQIKEPL